MPRRISTGNFDAALLHLRGREIRNAAAASSLRDSLQELVSLGLGHKKAREYSPGRQAVVESQPCEREKREIEGETTIAGRSSWYLNSAQMSALSGEGLERFIAVRASKVRGWASEMESHRPPAEASAPVQCKFFPSFAPISAQASVKNCAGQERG